MAANTVRAGYTVIGYDVDAARVREHVRAGGTAARSSADVRTRADIVICSLPSPAAVAQVAAELADSDGAEIVVETSTMPIAVKVAAQQRLAEAGVTLLDCPLSGTGSQAKVRDIVVYASATGHVLVDVLGFFDESTFSSDGRFQAVTPVRAVDTRVKTSIHQPASSLAG